MAGRKRRHRMTPARRAALRKAQAASARKRHGNSKLRVVGNVAKGVGVVGGTLVAGAATQRLAIWQVHPSQMGKDLGNFKKEVTRGVNAIRRRSNQVVPAKKPSMGYWTFPR